MCDGKDAPLIAKQCETAFNITDPLSKYTDAATRVRHFLFMMGYPEKALKIWRESKAFKTYKPKKLAPDSELS